MSAKENPGFTLGVNSYQGNGNTPKPSDFIVKPKSKIHAKISRDLKKIVKNIPYSLFKINNSAIDLFMIYKVVQNLMRQSPVIPVLWMQALIEILRLC